MDLLVINKSSSSSQSPTINFSGFEPSGQATIWQYGETQDTAQSQTANGSAALANFTQTLAVTGASVSMAFPAYSMTVVDLGKAPAPYVTVANYNLAFNSLAVEFRANVSASLSSSDLTLNNLSSDSTVPAGNIAEIYDAATNVATFTFPGYPGGILPGGVYSALLPAAGITDAGGDPLSSNFTFAFVLVNAGQRVDLPGTGQTYTIQQLLIGAGGTLDLGGDTLLLQYAAGSDPGATIQSWLAAGYNAGRWNGTGIISSVAAGAATGLTGAGYYDSGQSIRLAAGLYGDANLDSQINADDLSLMLLGQAQGSVRWQDGNFNYDSKTDADDWMLFMRGAASVQAAQPNELKTAMLMAAVVSLPKAEIVSSTSGAGYPWAFEKTIFDCPGGSAP
jgi:hypothetical protein